jgi:DICT domain-containing protein
MSNSLLPEADRLLTVGELARRTGVATATLRSWEARYGFPTSTRRAGGHRRYDPHQVALVSEVVRFRKSGLSVPASISAAEQSVARPATSFFASLRAGAFGLRPHVLGKRTLSAVTSAIEDECLAQARRPLLIGAFQRARFYRQSEERWQELSRTAERTVVFADFASSRSGDARPTEVPLAADSPVRREWVLVCDSPEFAACVAGWELPAPAGTAEQDRRFETVWTLDPPAVRAATRVGIALVGQSDPGLSDELTASLADVGGRASPDLVRATSLFGRIVDYAQTVHHTGGLAS